MGSPAVAAWIAHVEFWVSWHVAGCPEGWEIRGMIIALSLWLTAYIGLSG